MITVHSRFFIFFYIIKLVMIEFSDPRHLNGRVLQTAPRCHLKEVRRRLLWDVHSRAHDDIAAVVREERALAVEVFPV